MSARAEARATERLDGAESGCRPGHHELAENANELEVVTEFDDTMGTEGATVLSFLGRGKTVRIQCGCGAQLDLSMTIKTVEGSKR